MAGQGGNLQQPSKKVLFNTISSSNIGVYYDNKIGAKVLQLKEHGYAIPFLGTNTKVMISHTTAWQPKVQLVKLNGYMPCVECNYDYGFNIRKTVKKPGVDNPDYQQKMNPYSGVITKPALEGGSTTAMANTQINEMKESLIEQINNDEGYKPAFSYEHPGAIVKAGKAYVVSGYTAGDTVTINGTTYGGGLTTVALIVAAINAGSDAYAYVHPVTATSFIIIAYETSGNGNTFVVTAAGMTLSEIYIGLIAKYEDVNFSVEIDEFFGTNFLEVQKNRYSQLHADEIYQMFSHVPNMGALGQMTRKTVPEDVPYVKICIVNKMDHYDLQGASHANTFLAELEIYMKESELLSATNKFLSTNFMSTAGVYDNDFNKLTGYWNGTGTGWADVVTDLPY